MMRFLFLLLLMLATPAFAQQQIDSATLQRAITILQQQRNQQWTALQARLRAGPIWPINW
jgi:hypothetical protein